MSLRLNNSSITQVMHTMLWVVGRLCVAMRKEIMRCSSGINLDCTRLQSGLLLLLLVPYIILFAPYSLNLIVIN